jgi:ligand-binding sensor domain-containing protein
VSPSTILLGEETQQITMRRYVLGLLWLLLALQIPTVISYAEQLPVKTYTTGEGLPRDSVTLVRQDSRGFIWLATGEGLSRFDGYKFTNYTTASSTAA